MNPKIGGAFDTKFIFDIPRVLAFTPGTTLSLIAFVSICLAIVMTFLLAAVVTTASRRQAIRVCVGLGIGVPAYLVLIALIVRSGLLERAFVPFGPLFLVISVGIAVTVGLSSLGGRIAKGVPIAFLVGFQSFRLPLELVLHDWYGSGTIPKSMTWTGSNWDIASGAIALAACAFVTKRRWLAWIVNVVGVILLINVARVAILSSPVPFGWQVEPKLELVLYLPYAYIVPICVGGAALGHVLLTRSLLGAAEPRRVVGHNARQH